MPYIQPNQRDLLGIIKYPLLTEKTIKLIEQNQYSFAVDPKATKTAVKSAVEKLFDVKVISLKQNITLKYVLGKLTPDIIDEQLNINI